MQNHLALVSTLKYREHIMSVAKFPSLLLGGFSFRFSLYGDEANCLLECNEDIQTLLLVNNLICNLDVEVYVRDKNEMSIVSNSCALSFGSSETTRESGPTDCCCVLVGYDKSGKDGTRLTD
ncbi:unnamed protein product [Malus baccata var. baccata]